MPKMPKTRYVIPHMPIGDSTNLLERHYSYECKASAQDRPYVSRPSRSQQLRNPKLVPKLTNDVPNSLEKKKGAADEELAKKEAERNKRRELDTRDDDSDDPQRRARSPSVDSISTVSTNSRAGSATPPPRSRQQAGPGSESGEEIDELAHLPPKRQRSRSRSPNRRRVARDAPELRRRDGDRRRRSRSPREERGDRGDRDRRHPRYHNNEHRQQREERRDEQQGSRTRERSLSPFSQRALLTRGM